MRRPAHCALLSLFLLAPSLAAQGSRVDYERSAGLRGRFAGLLVDPDPQLAWDPDGRHAVYLARRGDGRTAVQVIDLESGEDVRSTELGELGFEGRPDRLVLLAGNLVLWSSERDQAWFLPADGDAGRAVELTEVPELLARPAGERERSGGSSERSSITVLNRGDVPLTVDWVDGGGEKHSYGSVPPGGRFQSSSFVGHVWELRAGERVLGRCAVAEQSCAAVVVGDELRVGRRPGGPPPERAVRVTGRDPRPYRIEFREHDVWLASSGADDWRALTTDGEEQDGYGGRVLWSPDGSHALLLRTRRGTRRDVHYVEAAPRDQLQPELHSYAYRKPGDDVDRERPLLVDCERGTATLVDDALFPNPWDLSDLRWSPDGNHVTFRYNQRGHQVLRMIAVDVRGAKPRVIVDESPATFVDYSQKAWHRWLEERGDLLWTSERSGWNHLYRFDAATGRLRNAVTRGEWVLRGVDRVDEEAGQVWFRAMGVYPDQDPYHVHHGRVDLDGTHLVWLTEGDGTHRVEFSPDGRYLVDRYSRVDLPPVTELRRASDGSLVRELARADDSALRAAGWRPPQRFVAKGRDGTTDIWGVLQRPTNFDPAGSYPVVESIYAGPHGHFVPKDFRVHSRQAELAELGFVVVQIDGMGTNWRSRAFHDVAWRNLADAGLPDRRLWIEAAAREDPALDLTRVGIYGGSAGGQNALSALLSHGDFYKVAVADCGCHDNRMDKIWWNEAWMGWPVGPHYEEQSNVTRAHLLQGDLLLIVGEKDENVDPASTMQVVDALVRADKDFDLLVIPGVGHGAAETPYGTRRRRDFLVRHLLGVEPRWE